jgi:hypothetical protein
VDTRVQALLASVDDTPLGKIRPCDIYKLENSLKMGMPCRLDGIPNEMPQASSKKTTGTSDTLI